MRSPTARVSRWDSIGSATFSAGTTAEQEGTAEGDPSLPVTPRTEVNASSTGQDGRTVTTEETGGNLEELETTTSVAMPEEVAAEVVTG